MNRRIEAESTTKVWNLPNLGFASKNSIYDSSFRSIDILLGKSKHTMSRAKFMLVSSGLVALFSVVLDAQETDDKLAAGGFQPEQRSLSPLLLLDWALTAD